MLDQSRRSRASDKPQQRGLNVALSIPGVQITPSKNMPADRLRMLIHGPQGAGKTYLASSIAELGKTLFVDMIGEKGGRSFKGAAWEGNIDVVRPTTITQLEATYNSLAAGGHGYQAVVIDSISAAQKSAMRFILGYDESAVSEIKKGRSGPDMRAWGNILEIMTDLCTFWYSLADGQRSDPMHVVFTSQTKAHEDDEGEVRLYPDVSKGSRSMALATPDFVVYADYEEVAAEDGSGMEMRHVLRIGPDMRIATKARIPVNLQGKIPPVLGLSKTPLSLATLCKALGIK
jgi:hypothetical protein